MILEFLNKIYLELQIITVTQQCQVILGLRKYNANYGPILWMFFEMSDFLSVGIKWSPWVHGMQ